MKLSSSSRSPLVLAKQTSDEEEVDLSQYVYPPDTAGAEGSGFVFNLTPLQKEQLSAVKAFLHSKDVSARTLNSYALHPDLTLLRYLRANKFEADSACQHIARNVAWREESAVNSLLELSPEEILGCPMKDLQRYLPHWQCGFDKTGRPVIYKQYGSFENNLLSEISAIDCVTKYHVWEQEVISKLCYEQSKKTGRIVETSFAVMDLEGMQMRQVTKDFLMIVKAFANIDQAQYPETLGRLLIINAPTMFPYVWSWVKPWLDPVVASKIQIFGGESTWKPVLLDLIGRDGVPQNYGGDLPVLTTDLHPYPGFERGIKLPAPLRMLSEESARGLSLTRDRRASFRRTPSLVGDVSRGSDVLSSSANSSTDHAMLKRRSLSHVLSGRHFGAVGVRASARLVSEDTFRYPDGTPGKDSPDGYVFSLTVAQASALKSIQQWMQDDHVDAGEVASQALHPNLVLLRYLRANKFDVEACIAHLKRNVAWRKERDVAALNDARPEEILGCPMKDLQRYLPHWQCGFDKTGRPVIYKQYGSFENDLLRDHCDLDSLTKYHIFEQEIISKLCYMQSRKTGRIVETSFAVMDLEGMQLRQVTSDFLAIVKAFANIDQAQYPETLGRLLIINAPSAFPWVWRGVKSFLDPVVTSKIQIFGGESTWRPVLLDLIGEDQIPANYGGQLPVLSADMHPYPSSIESLSLTTAHTLHVHGGSHDGDDASDTESVDSMAFFDAVEMQEVQDISRILTQRENFVHEFAKSLLVFKALTDMSLVSLSGIFNYCLFAYLGCIFTAMVLSAYALNSGPWIVNAYDTEKWAIAVIVIVSFFLFVVVFIGFVGNLIKIFFLLNFFAGSVAVGSLLYGIVSLASFAYYSRDVSNPAMNEYRLTAAIGCLLLLLIGLGPIAVARALAFRSSLEQDKRLQPQQLRVVIRTINIVCAFFAVGMIAYGGVSMKFMFDVHLKISSAVYSVYGLVYCGVTILISGCCGFWVSVTTRRNVVSFYRHVFVPLIATLLLAASIVSFANLATMREHDYSDSFVRSQISTQLLISGILFIFCFIFHLISAFVSRRLWIKMDEDFSVDEHHSRFKYANTLTVRKKTAQRSRQESLLISFGVLGGLFCIYFKGTFVIFADFVRDDSTTYSLGWMSNPFYGPNDPRYYKSDAYILASDGSMALVVGPLMLLYAWSTFVRAPFRHLIGVIVAVAIIYNTFVYYGIEMRRDFDDTRYRDQGVFAITLILDITVGLILPLSVLVYESSVLNRVSSKAYSLEYSKRVKAGRTSLLRLNGKSTLRSRAVSTGREESSTSGDSRATPPATPNKSQGGPKMNFGSWFPTHTGRINDTHRSPQNEDGDFTMTI